MGQNNNKQVKVNLNPLRKIVQRFADATIDVSFNALENVLTGIVLAVNAIVGMVVSAYKSVKSGVKAVGNAIQSTWEGIKSFCVRQKNALIGRIETHVNNKEEQIKSEIEEDIAKAPVESKQSLLRRIFRFRNDTVEQLLKEMLAEQKEANAEQREANATMIAKLEELTEVVRNLDPTLVPEPKMMHQDVLDADPKVTEPFENEPVIELLPSIMMENANKVIEETRMVEADTEVVDPVDDEVEAPAAEVEEIEKEKEEIRLQIDAHYEAVAEKYYMYDFESQNVDAEYGREGNAAGLPVGVDKLREMVENDESLKFLVSDADPEWRKKNWNTLRKLMRDARFKAIEKYTAS